MLQSWHAFQTFNANLVHRKACIRSVTACRDRALVTVWLAVLSSAFESDCMMEFRFENAPIHRVAASKVSKSHGGRSATSVQWIVTPFGRKGSKALTMSFVFNPDPSCEIDRQL
jgi:hypothetical protein